MRKLTHLTLLAIVSLAIQCNPVETSLRSDNANSSLDATLDEELGYFRNQGLLLDSPNYDGLNLTDVDPDSQMRYRSIKVQYCAEVTNELLVPPTISVMGASYPKKVTARGCGVEVRGNTCRFISEIVKSDDVKNAVNILPRVNRTLENAALIRGYKFVDNAWELISNNRKHRISEYFVDKITLEQPCDRVSYRVIVGLGGNNNTSTTHVKSYKLALENEVFDSRLDDSINLTGTGTLLKQIGKSKFIFATHRDGKKQVLKVDPSTGKMEIVSGDSDLVAASYSSADSVVSIFDKFLYYPDESISALLGYEADLKTGALKPIPGMPIEVWGTSRSVVTSTNGKFIYFGNANNMGSLLVYGTDSAVGKLTPVAGSPFQNLGVAHKLTVHPNGQFLFGIGTDPQGSKYNQLQVYRLNPETGVPTKINENTFEPCKHIIGSFPQELTLTKSGKYAYMTCFKSPNVIGFSVDEMTGKFLPVPELAIKTLSYPRRLRLDPSGQYLFVGDMVSAGSRLVIFKLNASTGVATTASGSPIDIPNSGDTSIQFINFMN